MEKQQKSKLLFKDFIVPKLLFERVDVKESESQFIITPKAVINRSKNEFNILIEIEIKDIQNNFTLKMSGVGIFEFESVEESILKDFLSINGPAIVFPYMRSFISSVTSLSGFGTIMIPTLNLLKFKDSILKDLKEI